MDSETEEKKGFCSSQSVNGGQDVWSCDNSTSSTSVDHLVIMVNGILGSSTDWKFGAEQFVKMLPDKVFVHCSVRNVSSLTLDGVDVMGERLSEEVIEMIKQMPEVRRISFVAHSVGGLVARYAIGRLYRPPRRENADDASTNASDEDYRGTIYGLEAMNLITVATPHLGSRGKNQVPFLFGVTALEKTASCVIHWIFRRTGRHLFLTDAERGEAPLLRRMVDDFGDLNFMSALRAFKRRVIYSNTGYDHIVGWRTSSIRRKGEFPEWKECLDEKYPHIVHEEICKPNDSDQSSSISVAGDAFDILEDEIVAGLSRVSWEKVHVSFHGSKQKFAAHSVIQISLSFSLSRIQNRLHVCIKGLESTVSVAFFPNIPTIGA